MYTQTVIAFLVPLITVLIVTPYIMRLASKIGAIDKPNERKVHSKVMPRIGGLAIFLGVVAGYFTGGLHHQNLTAITLGAFIVVIVGVLDDIRELSAKVKLVGQLLAAILVAVSGLTIDHLSIPFIGNFELGIWSYPLTILWIVGIMNAINLIDGLDGLSAGISAIVIATIAILAGINGKMLILMISVILLGSIIGFLFYNFYPAKIFMGDSGSLFLGYSISILSLLGLYKSVTLFSFLVPIIILGVPVFDTTFAIIRRIVNKKPILAPDKAHLHHRLLSLGLSHRNTVLAIYIFGILFSVSAILLSEATLWGSVFIIFGLLLITEIFAELIGIVHGQYKPILNLYKKLLYLQSFKK